MNAQQNPIFTIGHSTHAIGTFVQTLRTHGVTVVADVRSLPFSRFNPQFNKDLLTQSLGSHGIAYLYLGRELGARSEDPSCYENARVQYSLLAQTQLFKGGLERAIAAAQDGRIALMCAEKEPLDCHRTILIAQALAIRGFEIHHILEDGRVEEHASTLTRLLDLVGLPRQDLFRSSAQLIEDALAQQEARIAYVDEKRGLEVREDGP